MIVKLKLKFVFGTLVLAVLLIIILIINYPSKESDYLNITKVRQNELFVEDKLTSIGVINEFFNALRNGDVEKLNEQFVQHYFENTDIKNGYSGFSKQKITDIRVKLLDKSTDKDKFYEVVFTIMDNSAPPFIIAGSGEKTYFFNIILENEDWKIKGIATSP
jgi:hypothetical protein